MDIFVAIVQMIVVLVLVLILVLITLKLGGKKYNDLQKNKYIKVIEKVQLSKENSIALIKLGEKGCILGCSTGKIEKIEELTEDEMMKLEQDKETYNKKIIENFNLMFKLRGRRK